MSDSTLATRRFAAQVASLHAQLARDGLAVADMRRASALELELAGTPDLGTSHRPRPVIVERLEGDPVIARPVAARPAGGSRLRYFLDGSQRTLPVWRCGVVPVVAVVAAAAVLARDAAGCCSIAPGTLRLRHVWLIPRRAPEPKLAALLDRLATLDAEVVDPLDALGELSEDDYLAAADDYGRLVELAYNAARAVREEIEITLLDEWSREHRDGDGWIAVDGRLRLAAPRALGIVKALTNQHLSGAEAVMLLDLPPGHRTTAFQADVGDRRRGVAPGISPTLPQATGVNAPSLWYLRLHDAAGLDARHGLIRVEAAPAVRETAEIDELSSWLLAERAPRPTADARWATLLYPVHYLERMLKRCLDADTVGWAAG